MKMINRIFLAVVLVAAGWAAQRGLKGDGLGAQAAVVERGMLMQGGKSSVGVGKNASERVIEGKVTRVSDGDTIWVTDGMNLRHKIRMLDTDAPESSQVYGSESTKALSSRIYTKRVKVTYRELDQYGRVLGTVWLGGEDINLWMVREGHSWAYHYTKNPPYLAAMRAAKAAKKGLWAKGEAQDPWAYRKVQKGEMVPGGSADRAAAGGTASGMTASGVWASGVTASGVTASGVTASGVTASGVMAGSAAGTRDACPYQRKEYRAGNGPMASRVAAPVNGDWPETGYWLSTSSNKRHNRRCENYRKTRGYPCQKGEGAACGKCGG